VLHGSNYATGAVSVDGSVTPGDIALVTIQDRQYSYTIQADDTLEIIRDKLIMNINADPMVLAYKANLFTRIRLQARVPGPEGNGIVYTASSAVGTISTSGTASVIMTALSSSMCCANEAYSPVTDVNPALPGETIIVYATGLGLVKPDEAQNTAITGTQLYRPV